MAKSSSAARVAAAAETLELAIDIVEMPAQTRTAEDAAEACGCTPDQIVKSLIFETSGDGRLVLLLIPGGRQADLDAAGAVIGGTLSRADPKRVRAETGFAIGGVSPIGHIAPIDVFYDPQLMAFDWVWAAAGSPSKVFRVDPKVMIGSLGAKPLA